MTAPSIVDAAEFRFLTSILSLLLRVSSSELYCSSSQSSQCDLDIAASVPIEYYFQGDDAIDKHADFESGVVKAAICGSRYKSLWNGSSI